jgi:peptide/nickel transport system substrate-binding protein
VNPAELVVSGPFKLKTLRPGEAMVFERNPHYFRYDVEGTQLPYLDEVVAQIIPDSQATHVAFLAGKTDLQEGIDPQLLAQFLDEAPAKGFTVYPLGGSLNINHYFFNLNQGGTYPDAEGKQQVWQPSHPGEKPTDRFQVKSNSQQQVWQPSNADEKPTMPGFKPFVDPIKLGWFSNREFRLACSEATNRQRMIDTVLYGQGEPLYGLVPPANREWYNPQAPIYPYNPTAAKARLDKLGWIDKDGDGIREDAQGHPIRFTLLTTRESNTREKILQLLKEDLRAVGLGAEAQVVQFNNLITRIQDTYDYDAIMLGLGTGVPPHPSMAGNTWRSAGDTHLGYPSQKAPMTPWEAELDRLYGSMKHSFDVKEQQKIYFEMQVIFNEAQPAIHTFTGKSFVAAKNNIGNLKPTIIRSSVTHNIQELYIR